MLKVPNHRCATDTADACTSSKTTAETEQNERWPSLYHFFCDTELFLWSTSIQFRALGGSRVRVSNKGRVLVMTGFSSGSVVASLSPAAILVAGGSL